MAGEVSLNLEVHCMYSDGVSSYDDGYDSVVLVVCVAG